MSSYVQRLRTRLASCPALDVPFLAILLILLCFGLIMLFSAGYAVALYRRGDAYTYIRPQLLFAALGVVAMYIASLVDYHIWHKLAWPLMGLSLVLLTVVLFMPEYNGCKRWIVLPGLGTLQPSEIAKFSVVLVFSHIISLNHDRMKTFSTGVLPFGLILGTVAVLMLLEPHLSGTLLILSIGAVLMFVGGTGLKWFGIAGGLGVGAIAAAVIALPELVPYATDRLVSWRDPFADPLGEGHQTIQSLYAIASGWAWATAARNISMCRNPRTTLSFLFCARNWALSARRWWCYCFFCCFCGAFPSRCARRINSARCWWWDLWYRWCCRRCSTSRWSPIPSPIPASVCHFFLPAAPA